VCGVVNKKDLSTAGADVMLIIVALVVVPIFFIEQVYISRVNGWWWPELFSLVATKPELSFAQAAGNIATDSIPPLFLSLLYAVRKLISDDRSAVITLNMFGFLASALR
jgi:hypothetical protein